MTFLIDENFPRSAAEVLSAAGHETLFVISLRQPNRANILARLKWFVEFLRRRGRLRHAVYA